MKDSNSWFHHLKGNDLFEKDEENFKEYRKKWKEWPNTFDIGDFPLFIDIEVTNNCNLKCPFCATTISGGKIKKGFISEEHVKKIIDEGADNGLYGVKFNIRGEPLLHKKIDYFVKYAKNKKMIDVYFNTNAVLLTKEMAIKLIDSGLDRISISFEGYTKEVYEKNRVGSNYELVIKNIENLQNLKEKLKVNHPDIRVQTIKILDDNFSLEKYGHFWKDKVEEVAYLDYQDMTKKNKGIISSWVCPEIWQRMAVYWNGTITPCNHDDDMHINLGNIDDISIKAIWNSNELKNMRTMHKNGLSHKIDACNGCYLRNSEIFKYKEK